MGGSNGVTRSPGESRGGERSLWTQSEGHRVDESTTVNEGGVPELRNGDAR